MVFGKTAKALGSLRSPQKCVVLRFVQNDKLKQQRQLQPQISTG